MTRPKKPQLDKPGALETLIKYNEKVLLPELEKKFLTKKDYKNSEEKIFDRFDKLFENQETLLQEKEVRKYQSGKN